MIKGVQAVSERFLIDLNRIQERSERVQYQLSSGIRVQRASDAPEAVSNIFSLRALLEHNKQIDQNLASVGAEVNAGEAAVSQAVNLLQRVNSLATQTAGTDTGAPRNSVLIELDEIKAQLHSLSGTTSQGRPVFLSDTETREIEDNHGNRFSVACRAVDVFQNPAGDAYAALDNLISALQTGGDVQAVLPDLKNAQELLNQQLTYYGVSQNRIATAIDTSSRATLALTKELSSIQDTDVAAAIVELSLTTTQQQAALAAHSKLPNSSLFDYLG